MHAMAKATLEAIPERTTAAVGRLTGLAYALTSPICAREFARSPLAVMSLARNGSAH